MKQQLVLTHRYTMLQGTKEMWWIPHRPTFKQVIFLRKHKDKGFFRGPNILTGVFVSQLSNNAGILVWRIVWVTTNCCFMRDILKCKIWCYYHYTAIRFGVINMHHRQLGILTIKYWGKKISAFWKSGKQIPAVSLILPLLYFYKMEAPNIYVLFYL
jgi:hypothetical protein